MKLRAIVERAEAPRTLGGFPVQVVNIEQSGVDEAYSDVSGLIAASSLNRSFIITADLAEGGRKRFRVQAQSERVAREKFLKHHAQVHVLSVEEEGVAEGQTPEQEIERLKLRQNAEHGGASLKRQAATQARIRELEKQIKDKKGVVEGTGNGYYYLQGGIERSKKFASEAEAMVHIKQFFQLARVRRVTLKYKEPGQPAVVVKEFTFNSPPPPKSQMSWGDFYLQGKKQGMSEEQLDELTFKGSPCTKDTNVDENRPILSSPDNVVNAKKLWQFIS